MADVDPLPEEPVAKPAKAHKRATAVSQEAMKKPRPVSPEVPADAAPAPPSPPAPPPPPPPPPSSPPRPATVEAPAASPAQEAPFDLAAALAEDQAVPSEEDAALAAAFLR